GRRKKGRWRLIPSARRSAGAERELHDLAALRTARELSALRTAGFWRAVSGTVALAPESAARRDAIRHVLVATAVTAGLRPPRSAAGPHPAAPLPPRGRTPLP